MNIVTPVQTALIPQGATREDMERIIRELSAKVEAQRVAATRKLTLKVSEKGAVSMYGLGRFPVSLYKDTWIKLLAEKEVVLAFIEANKDSLSVKD